MEITLDKTVKCRRYNLQKWIDDFYNGVQSSFIRENDLNQGEISALLRSKTFGEVKARKLEEKCQMPGGYLDTFRPEIFNMSIRERFELELSSSGATKEELLSKLSDKLGMSASKVQTVIDTCEPFDPDYTKIDMTLRLMNSERRIQEPQQNYSTPKDKLLMRIDALAEKDKQLLINFIEFLEFRNQ